MDRSRSTRPASPAVNDTRIGGTLGVAVVGSVFSSSTGPGGGVPHEDRGASRAGRDRSRVRRGRGRVANRACPPAAILDAA